LAAVASIFVLPAAAQASTAAAPEMREFDVSLWSLVIFFLSVNLAISQATKIAAISATKCSKNSVVRLA
jgi:hypothetical protein